MSEGSYTEPTNEQLANFLSIYARDILQVKQLDVSPATIEFVLERRPDIRRAALDHHREFQERINELTRKMQAGELQCEHIRPNGKRCPNFNEPGSIYCGLHKDPEDRHGR